VVCFDLKATFPAIALPTLRKLYLITWQLVLHLPESLLGYHKGDADETILLILGMLVGQSGLSWQC
jgi:hypothetical protein